MTKCKHCGKKIYKVWRHRRGTLYCSMKSFKKIAGYIFLIYLSYRMWKYYDFIEAEPEDSNGK